MTAATPLERPVAPFVLSLISGVFILGGSGMMMAFSGQPYYGGMMGGYGGMMDGYFGMMSGYGASWFLAFAEVGIVSGVLVLLGATMLYNRPRDVATWGALVLAASVVSLFGMDGFFLGAMLGIVGGILALTWKNQVSFVGAPSK